MKYKVLLLIVSLLTLSYCGNNDTTKIVVYPEYCKGCIIRNFAVLGDKNLFSQYQLFFDSTDNFLLQQSKLNQLQFTQIDFNDIRSTFGDYANIAIIPPYQDIRELKTNETINTEMLTQ